MSLRLLVGWTVVALGLAGCAEDSGFSDTQTNNPGGQGGQGGVGGGGGGAGAGGAGAMGAMGGQGGGSPCDEDPCKLVTPQCGCAEGQMCTLNSTEGRVCAAEGPNDEGEQCNDDNLCKAGFLCAKTKSTPPVLSTCMELCTEDTQCEGPGALCIINVTGAPEVKLCSQSCDPVAATGCPVNQTHCEVVLEAGGEMRAYTRCVGQGDGTQGDPCTTAEDCIGGFACIDDPNVGAKVCRQWCIPGQSTCTAGVCTALPSLVVEGTQYGVCL